MTKNMHSAFSGPDISVKTLMGNSAISVRLTPYFLLVWLCSSSSLEKFQVHRRAFNRCNRTAFFRWTGREANYEKIWCRTYSNRGISHLLWLEHTKRKWIHNISWRMCLWYCVKHRLCVKLLPALYFLHNLWNYLWQVYNGCIWTYICRDRNKQNKNQFTLFHKESLLLCVIWLWLHEI